MICWIDMPFGAFGEVDVGCERQRYGGIVKSVRDWDDDRNNKEKQNVLLFKSGNRTFIVSGLLLICALVLQGHSEGLYTLSPFIKMAFTFTMTALLPLVPVYIRKAIKSIASRK